MLGGPFGSEVFSSHSEERASLHPASEGIGLAGFNESVIMAAPSPPPDFTPAPKPSMVENKEISAKLDWILRASHEEWLQALEELSRGHKQSHWIWWVFPTLAARGGDMNSAMMRADLNSISEAAAYARHPRLRQQLIDSLNAATAAFARASSSLPSQVPWQVLDESFGRSADGVWVGGPVDSFKLFCSATLFAGLAYKEGDDELRQAALSALSYFTGDIIYSAAGPGSAGFMEDASMNRNILVKADNVTLALLGLTWEEVSQ